MPRKRVVAPKPVGRQAAWSAMYRLSVFSVRDVARATDVHYRTITTYARSLEAAGILQVYGQHDDRSTLYLLTDEQRRRYGATAPRINKQGEPVTSGFAVEQMWRTMKRLVPGWSPRHLAEAASTDQVAVTRGYAQGYCRALACAGYLRVLGGRSSVRYAFLPHRDSGPLPPKVRAGHVFDQNLGRITWPVEEAALTAGPVAS